MSSQNTMGRRRFLVVSSTGALATAVLGPQLFGNTLIGATPRRIAVGYAPLEEKSAVMAASSVGTADGAFISRGARVLVSGASGLASEPRGRRAVELVAHYSYFDGAERKTTPFHAWAGSRSTGVQGSPAAFTFPVDEVQKISFTVSAETGAPAGAASRRDALTIDSTERVDLPLVLSLQREPGSFELVRGFYVVVPIFEGDSDPRWSSYSLSQREGRWTLVDGEERVAPFEHFVLRIDYAA